MATLEELQVKISADTSALRADLQRLNSTVSSSTNKMQGAFNGVAASLRGLVPALSVSAFVSFGKSALQAAGRLKDLSERTGITVTTLSALQPALNASGSSIESFAALIAVLNNKIGEAASGNQTAIAAFNRLGLSVEDLLSKSNDQRIISVANALGQIGDQAEIAAAGQDVFGRRFAQIIPLLREADGDLTKYIETQKQLGKTLDEDIVDKVDKVDDAFTKLWTNATNNSIRALAAVVDFVDFLDRNLPQSINRDEYIAKVAREKAAQNYTTDLDSILSQAGVSLPSSTAQSKIPTQNFTKLQTRIPKPTASSNTNKNTGSASNAAIVGQTKRVTKAVEEQADAYQRLEDQRKAQADAERERQDMMRQYAYSFESAFEDAIVQGKKLADVLDELGKDVLRSVLRAQITAPLTESISGGIGSMFGGGNFFSSLISALPSFDVGTPYVPRDMLAMVHKGEAIIPANQNKPGGGVAINIINNSSAQVSASQQQSGNGMDIRVMIDEAVAANIARSGSRTSQAINSYNNRALVRR